MRQPALSILMAAMMPWAWGGKIAGRYIVELETEPVAAHVQRQAGRGRARMDSEAGRAQRERIRGEQGVMRGRIEGRGGRVLGGVETVANALFVEATEAEAAQLAGAPGVRRVRQERTYRLLMDRAVQLQKVVEAWNRVGVERAGEGIKIGIIDSGIDVNHAAFQDTTMSAPEGFPKLNYSGDAPNTNGKVIVARSYVELLPYRDVDYSSLDHIGHGTALGAIAAGGKSDGPLGTIMGVAPRAWVGNYKVFGTPGYNDSSTDSAILKALDDAVADGMDVINMSLGDDFAPRLKDDVEVEAVERAVRAGVIVVVAAGNNGPGMNTISSPATAPSALAAGATSNDRTFGTSVEAAGVGTFLAYTGSGPVPWAPASGPLADVEALDGNGLACGSLPGGSLSGRVALILRGSCTFETKLIYAQRAGAVGAVVYATSESPAPIGMSVGTATLAAQMVSHDDGIAMKRSLGGGAGEERAAGAGGGRVPFASGKHRGTERAAENGRGGACAGGGRGPAGRGGGAAGDGHGVSNLPQLRRGGRHAGRAAQLDAEERREGDGELFDYGESQTGGGGAGGGEGSG